MPRSAPRRLSPCLMSAQGLTLSGVPTRPTCQTDERSVEAYRQDRSRADEHDDRRGEERREGGQDDSARGRRWSRGRLPPRALRLAVFPAGREEGAAEE